jgi:hypothetical protein
MEQFTQENGIWAFLTERALFNLVMAKSIRAR